MINFLFCTVLSALPPGAPKVDQTILFVELQYMHKTFSALCSIGWVVKAFCFNFKGECGFQLWISSVDFNGTNGVDI